MTTELVLPARTSLRTRLIAYGLLAYCVAMVLFGPLIAEWGLWALGCSASCSGLAMLPGNGLLPWLSRVPPVETAFQLWDQSGLWLGGWLGLVFLSRQIDRRTPRHAVIATPVEPVPPAVAADDPGFAARQAVWVREREAEQAEARHLDQLSFRRRMLAEGSLWAALCITLIVTVSGLVLFCLAFGTPLIGGLSAEGLLSSLSCSDPARLETHPLGGMCDFWVERLAPYSRPWFGALLAPVWLFTQFSDVLLGWVAAIAALLLAPGLRFGWSMLLKDAPRWLGGFVVVLIGMALASVLLDLSATTAPPVSRDYTLGGIGMLVPVLFGLLTVALVVVIVAVVAFIAMVITLKRRSGRPQATVRGDASPAPEDRPSP
ncbi:hypothetical protein [Pseudomarimonas salicorniae]|uniref:Uncharacterized protein n=1 Tax=Pseudomarimonas salicorniae TaxID=2933270 RepID=A0ABT0GJD9_9GAMM|nr:hypothetical protein [Lysobacter sp. CAU 1642]MCK7594147.1 hypothetical protein [Lysobacter sp. CAU 1642]